MSALHEAISEANGTQIEWLLEQGVDVNEPDAEGNTPLMLAVSRGIHAEHLRVLLERGADVHARDGAGRTPLMLSLDNGYFDSSELLLDYYAFIAETPEIDPTYEQGRLALLFAINNNDVTTLRTLLDARADPNARNEQGRTPLMLAAELDYPHVAGILLHHGCVVESRGQR